MRVRSAIFLYLFLVAPASVHAYGSSMHLMLNKAATTKSAEMGGIDISALLKNTLLFSGGLRTAVGGEEVHVRIANGGELEDEPSWRCLNHFNDPWANIGLMNSAPAWAMNRNDPQTGSFLRMSYGGDFSWPAAFRYYFIGLTGHDKVIGPNGYEYVKVAPSPQDRERYLGKGFRALGQVMHLVEDMSVPAHVRLDLHPGAGYVNATLASDDYEKWAERHAGTVQAEIERQILAREIRVIRPEDIISQRGSGVDVVALMDSDLLTRDEVVAGARAGLSEFANVNFVSRDTIFEGYDYPKAESVRPGPGGYFAYDVKMPDLQGSGAASQPVSHFLKANWLGSLIGATGAKIPRAGYQLDDFCHEDYSKVLGPQAAAYAAGVLNRFFEYELELLTPFGAGSPLYRVVRSGTRSPTSRGELPGYVSGSLLTIGVTDSGDLEIISPPNAIIGGAEGSVFGPDTSPSAPSSGCYDELIVVFDGLVGSNNAEERRYVLGSAVKAQLHLKLDPGASILSGFTAELAKPDSPACREVRLVDPSALQATGDLSVYGIRKDGTEVQVGAPSAWPAWAAGATGPEYTKYRVVFEGFLAKPGATPLQGEYVRLEKIHCELVANFADAVVESSFTSSLQGLSWTQTNYVLGPPYTNRWHTDSWISTDPNYDSSDSVSISGGVLTEQLDENCTIPEHYCYCPGPWTITGDILNHTIDAGLFLERPISSPSLTRDSRLVIDYDAQPAAQAFDLVLSLREIRSNAAKVETFTLLPGRAEARLGEMRPDLFAAGEEYRFKLLDKDFYYDYGSFSLSLKDGGCIVRRSQEDPFRPGIWVPVSQYRDVTIRRFGIFP